MCAEKSSEHPLALAVVSYCMERLADTPYHAKIHSPPDFKAITGKGVSCVVDDKTVGIGNRAFMKIINVPVAGDVDGQLAALENDGKTAIMVSVDGKLQAIMGISDQLKPDSPETVKVLQSMGIDVSAQHARRGPREGGRAKGAAQRGPPMGAATRTKGGAQRGPRKGGRAKGAVLH